MQLKFKCITYADFLNQYDLTTLHPFPSLLKYGRAKFTGKRIYLRHDIDKNIDASLMMAEYENSIGIKSHYYALHFTSDYWNKEGFKKLRIIQSMGHEVGFHNAVLSEYIVNNNIQPNYLWTQNDYKVIVNRVYEVIKQLRDEGLIIRGTCAHGHYTCGTHNYSNIQIWYQWVKHFMDNYSIDIKDTEMEYDCNIVYRDAYHSDSNNEWNGDPVVMANYYDQNQKTLMINIHPQWWV